MAKRIVFLLFVLSAVYIASSTRIKREATTTYVDAAVGSVAAVTRAIEKYNKELDLSIPWKNLTIAVDQFGQNIDQYSPEARPFVPRIRQNLFDGLHNYFVASQKVYEWTVHASSSLTLFLEALEAKGLLIRVLENGVVQLTESISELNGVSEKFDKAHNDMLSIKDQFDIDFKNGQTFFQQELRNAQAAGWGGTTGIAIFGALAAGIIAAAVCGPCGFVAAAAAAAAVETTGGLVTEKVFADQIRYRFDLVKTFYEDTRVKVNYAKGNTTVTQEAIKAEVFKMTEMKGTIISTEDAVVELTDKHRDLIVKSVKTLLQVCEEYRKRHGASNK